MSQPTSASPAQTVLPIAPPALTMDRAALLAVETTSFPLALIP
jgi:hypothetical protein